MLLVTVVALGVPILDTTFAILRRGFRGFPLFQADGDHIHHKLERYGFSKPRILFGIYGICVILSLLGLSIVWSQGRTLPIGIGALFLLAVAGLRYFHFLKSWEDVRRKVDRLIGERRHVQYAVLQAQVLELEVERCATRAEFHEVRDRTFLRIGFMPEAHPERGQPVLLRHNGYQPWTLHTPAPAHEDAHLREWQRIADCFRPVYIKAQAKWQS